MKDLLRVADNVDLFDGGMAREGVPRAEQAGYEFYSEGQTIEVEAFKTVVKDWEYITARVVAPKIGLPNHLEMARLKDFFWGKDEPALMIYSVGEYIPARLALWRYRKVAAATERKWLEMIRSVNEVVVEGLKEHRMRQEGDFGCFQHEELIAIDCPGLALSWWDVQMVRMKLGVEHALVQFVTGFDDAQQSGTILLWPATDMLLPEAPEILPEIK